MAAEAFPARSRPTRHISRRNLAAESSSLSGINDDEVVDSTAVIDGLPSTASVLHLDPNLGTITCSLRLYRKGSERFCFWTSENFFILVDLSKQGSGDKPIRVSRSKTPSVVTQAVYLASVGLICCVCLPRSPAERSEVLLPASFAFLSPLSFKLQALHSFPNRHDDPSLDEILFTTPTCLLDSTSYTSTSRTLKVSHISGINAPRLSHSDPHVAGLRAFVATIITADSNGNVAEWSFELVKTASETEKNQTSFKHNKITRLGDAVKCAVGFKGTKKSSASVVFGTPDGTLYTVRHPSLDIMKKLTSNHGFLRALEPVDARRFFSIGSDYLRVWSISSATGCTLDIEQRQPLEPSRITVSNTVAYVGTMNSDVLAFKLDGVLKDGQLISPERFFQSPIDPTHQIEALLPCDHGYITVSSNESSSCLTINLGGADTQRLLSDLGHSIVATSSASEALGRSPLPKHTPSSISKPPPSPTLAITPSTSASSYPAPVPPSPAPAPPSSPSPAGRGHTVNVSSRSATSLSSGSALPGTPIRASSSSESQSSRSIWRPFGSRTASKKVAETFEPVPLDSAAGPSLLRSARQDGEVLPSSPSRLRWANEIDVLIFPLIQGGSTSVPHDGSYSLGLAWVPKDVRRMELDLFDNNGLDSAPRKKKRMPAYRQPEERMAPIPHNDRKKLLKKFGGKLTKKELVELQEIRRTRAQVFCFCSSRGKSCSSERCPCFSIGIGCQIEAQRCCLCSAEHCANPEGVRVFNVRDVKTSRQETLRSYSSPSISV